MRITPYTKTTTMASYMSLTILLLLACYCGLALSYDNNDAYDQFEYESFYEQHEEFDFDDDEVDTNETNETVDRSDRSEYAKESEYAEEYVVDLDYLDPNKPLWDGLRVKWGMDPTNPYNFDTMPRTGKEARKENFTKIDDYVDCSADAKFRGVRYIKENDTSLVLLFDHNDVIVGLQTVIPKGLPFNYPQAGLTPPFIEMHDGYYLSVYFVPPHSICSYSSIVKGGRSKKDLKIQGTGTGLYIQNGTNPDVDYITVPHKASDTNQTKWVEGSCVRTMGVHYWHDISKTMSCDDFFPVFLLYNNGYLNAFGLGVIADLKSPRWEHLPAKAFANVDSKLPTCLADRGQLSTMHVFLTSTPRENAC